MKKLVLFFALIALTSISFVSCGNKTTKDTSSQDSSIVDTAKVDTAKVDSGVVSE